MDGTLSSIGTILTKLTTGAGQQGRMVINSATGPAYGAAHIVMDRGVGRQRGSPQLALGPIA